MIVEVDLINEVVLLLDAQRQVRDAFRAHGVTRHETPFPIGFYTYRSHLTPDGYCCLCGVPVEKVGQPCVSSGGFHAFVGLQDSPQVPEGHHAHQRSVPIQHIVYEEFNFYVESDNLFPIDEISLAMEV